MFGLCKMNKILDKKIVFWESRIIMFRELYSKLKAKHKIQWERDGGRVDDRQRNSEWKSLKRNFRNIFYSLSWECGLGDDTENESASFSWDPRLHTDDRSTSSSSGFDSLAIRSSSSRNFPTSLGRTPPRTSTASSSSSSSSSLSLPSTSTSHSRDITPSERGEIIAAWKCSRLKSVVGCLRQPSSKSSSTKFEVSGVIDFSSVLSALLWLSSSPSLMDLLRCCFLNFALRFLNHTLTNKDKENRRI